MMINNNTDRNYDVRLMPLELLKAKLFDESGELRAHMEHSAELIEYEYRTAHGIEQRADIVESR